MAVNFPPIRPTGRSYSPGEFPQTVFEAQNGATTVVRFGNKRVNSELALVFANITDAEADQILANYEEVNATWDYVVFTAANAVVGIGSSRLSKRMAESVSGLRYRYAEPPTVKSVIPGISSVTCSFIASLDPE